MKNAHPLKRMFPFLIFYIIGNIHATFGQDFNKIFDTSEVIVYLHGKPHNITGFLQRHPGGSMVLKMVNGQEISEYIAGHKYILGMCHQHYDAYSVLSQFAMDGGGGGGDNSEEDANIGTTKRPSPSQMPTTIPASSPIPNLNFGQSKIVLPKKMPPSTTAMSPSTKKGASKQTISPILTTPKPSTMTTTTMSQTMFSPMPQFGPPFNGGMNPAYPPFYPYPPNFHPQFPPIFFDGPSPLTMPMPNGGNRNPKFSLQNNYPPPPYPYPFNFYHP